MRTCASPMGFKEKDRPLLHMLARCAIAMSFLLRGHINRESAKPELEAVLLPGELNYVLVSNQPCLRIAQVQQIIHFTLLAFILFPLIRTLAYQLHRITVVLLLVDQRRPIQVEAGMACTLSVIALLNSSNGPRIGAEMRW